jgi:hypothetical protein
MVEFAGGAAVEVVRSIKRIAMLTLSLEERVAVLEQEVSELKSRPRQLREKDWRRTIGMFTDNSGMKELFAEAMKLRKADRSRARRQRQRQRPATSSFCSTRTTSPS